MRLPTISAFRTGLDVVASVVMILAGIAIVTVLGGASRSPTAPKPSPRKPLAIPLEPIDISAAATMGRADAPVTVVEFSDFQCPFCGQFARDTMPKIKTELIDSGILRLAFVQMPLGRIHPFAVPAARIATCSKNSGKFWEVHDAFFALPNTAQMDDFVAAAVGSGLRKSDLGKCTTTLGRAAVDRDVEFAAKLGVKSTPAFLFATSAGEGKVSAKEWLSGAIPFEKFKEAAERVRAGSLRAQ